MARLTVKDVEARRAGASRREIPDDYLRGLYLIIQPTGAKSWAVRYRLGGKPTKHTIGSYPAFGLKEARDKGAEILRAVAEGHSPRRAAGGTVAAAVEQFIERHGKNYRPKTLYYVRAWLQYAVDAWGDRKLDSLARADVRSMLDRIEAPMVANRVHGIVRKFFNWCVENDLIANSPATGVRAPNKEVSRDRVLTDDELREVWRAVENDSHGPIVRLLILTGQRRGEVAGMRWSELDLDSALWTLPRERVKNDRRHEVPLSKQAVAILRQVPCISDSSVFALAEPHNGLQRLKEKVGVESWTLHDLRRTCTSGMARLGVGIAVIEKILNHVSGSFAGIVGVYQRHEFADEKRAALQQWADHVERLVRS
jgi:integrase